MREHRKSGAAGIYSRADGAKGSIFGRGRIENWRGKRGFGLGQNRMTMRVLAFFILLIARGARRAGAASIAGLMDGHGDFA
jgi:hypothetical protein